MIQDMCPWDHVDQMELIAVTARVLAYTAAGLNVNTCVMLTPHGALKHHFTSLNTD